MSDYLERRFTMDKQHIYFINRGIVTRKSILQFIKEYPDVYNELYGIDTTVGWADIGSALMFTDSSEIYRVSDDILVDMMSVSGSKGIPCTEPGLIKLRYNKREYHDDFIITERGDSKFHAVMPNINHVGNVLESGERPRRCIIVQDPLSVYEVTDGRVYKQSLMNYIATRGEKWQELLRESDVNVGFTYKNPKSVLRILEDRIELMDAAAYDLIVKHPDTTIDLRTSSLYDYINVEYDNKYLTDEILGVTTEYKR